MLPIPPSPFRLRPMKLEDIDRVAVIERRSFPTMWPAAGYRHELSRNERAHYVVLISSDEEDEEKIIGYSGHWIVAEEAHISIIAVDPDWRGRGLGALLLLQMIYHALAHDATVISLEVRESNEVARTLYRQYGFREVGRRRRYYRDSDEDALLMDLDLTEAGIQERIDALRDRLWQRLGQG